MRALVLALLFFAGCARPLIKGECLSSADCSGLGKVCYAKVCVECTADADCSPGFRCAANKCSPPPSTYIPEAAPAPDGSNETQEEINRSRLEVGAAAPPPVQGTKVVYVQTPAPPPPPAPACNTTTTTINCASPPCPGPPPPPPPPGWWEEHLKQAMAAITGAFTIVMAAAAKKYASIFKTKKG